MSTTDYPDVGMVMAALTALLVLSGVVLAPTVAFLVIALVSLRGTQPADRPAILRGLAMLKRRGDEHGASWWRVWSSRNEAQLTIKNGAAGTVPDKSEADDAWSDTLLIGLADPAAQREAASCFGP